MKITASGIDTPRLRVLYFLQIHSAIAVQPAKGGKNLDETDDRYAVSRHARDAIDAVVFDIGNVLVA